MSELDGKTNHAAIEQFIARVIELGPPSPQPRDDNRPMEDYPRMPPHTCFLSADYLVRCYPELRAQRGELRFTMCGKRIAVPHAWNVAAHGQIIDSTWVAPDEAEDIEYVAG